MLPLATGLATVKVAPESGEAADLGALGGTRTPSLLIRSQMLYPLSYERWRPASLRHTGGRRARPRSQPYIDLEAGVMLASGLSSSSPVVMIREGPPQVVADPTCVIRVRKPPTSWGGGPCGGDRASALRIRTIRSHAAASPYGR
jgi:hypothetical protein